MTKHYLKPILYFVYATHSGLATNPPSFKKKCVTDPAGSERKVRKSPTTQATFLSANGGQGRWRVEFQDARQRTAPKRETHNDVYAID